MKIVLNLLYIPVILITRTVVVFISGSVQNYKYFLSEEAVFSLKTGLLIFGLLTVFDMFYYNKSNSPLNVFYAKRGIVIFTISTVIISFMMWIIPRTEEKSLIVWIIMFALGEIFRNYLAYLISKRKQQSKNKPCCTAPSKKNP